MKINWSQVPDDTFEEVVAALLRAMGYVNVVVRTGGGDDGWDVDAQLPHPLPDGSLRLETWRVECKRYSSPVPAGRVRDHYQRMARTGPVPNYVLFVTTSSLANRVKEDLQDFAEKDRVAVMWWEEQQLTSLVEKFFGDEELSALVSPYLSLDLPPDALRGACRLQVATEIQRRVGRKYIAELFRPRPIEGAIREFIAADLKAVQLAELAARLRRLRPPDPQPSAPAAPAPPAGEEWSAAVEPLAAAGSWHAAGPHLDRLLELADDGLRARVRGAINEVVAFQRNCFLVKDRAGSGKTNLLCRLATDAADGTLALFLSCKFDLPQSRSLEEVIATALFVALERERDEAARDFALPAGARELLQAVTLTLRKEGLQLVVYLDGINENRDLGALDAALTDLLARWNGLPVKFVVTCRDIFWSFFNQAEWESFFYGERPHDLPGFEEAQVGEVVGAYFKLFRINGRLAGRALEQCRHPLLLRFFCEAHGGRDIRRVEDLRLRDLFEEYWARKRREIAEALGLGGEGGLRVESFVFKLLDHMAERHATQILLGDIPRLTGEHDLESGRSLYQRLLDQDVILEELPPSDALDTSYHARRISFVYDEFYDYMMALNHIRKNGWDGKGVAQVLLDFVELTSRSVEFEQLRGVAEYLVLISEKKGIHRLLCAALARLGSYELLCNLLPKLRDETDWMADALRTCLLAVERDGGGPAAVKEAIGTQPALAEVKNLIEQTPPDRLYDRLLL